MTDDADRYERGMQRWLTRWHPEAPPSSADARLVETLDAFPGSRP